MVMRIYPVISIPMGNGNVATINSIERDRSIYLSTYIYIYICIYNYIYILCNYTCTISDVVLMGVSYHQRGCNYAVYATVSIPRDTAVPEAA